MDFIIHSFGAKLIDHIIIAFTIPFPSLSTNSSYVPLKALKDLKKKVFSLKISVESSRTWY